MVEGLSFGRGQAWGISGKVSETWTDDIGANYFRSYAPALRSEVCRLAEAAGVTSLTPGGQSGLVTAFPLMQPQQQRLVVHIVNCEIDDRLLAQSTGARWIRTRRPELYGPLATPTGREEDTRKVRFDNKGV